MRQLIGSDENSPADLLRPGSEIATLLALYDFTLANKLFSQHFITQPSSDTAQPTPFSAFLSFSSYLYQHAYRSARASLYAYLTLLILLILTESPTTAKLLCDTAAPVRLCRQRAPFLPLPKPAHRPYAAAILDAVAGGLSHNLRKRLDTAFYIQTLTVLSRLLTHLAHSRTKLPYHWSELWRALLSFLRFLNHYPDDLKSQPDTPHLVAALADLLALALTTGEAFLPDPADYDDLVYKLVENGAPLANLREVYGLAATATTSDEETTTTTPPTAAPAINTLVAVSTHYAALIEQSQRSTHEHLSPKEVARIIKQGYETLRLEPAAEEAEGVAAGTGFREAEHKVRLKRIARVAVADAGVVVSSAAGVAAAAW